MNTTIQISMETKEKIKTFGKKGETYEDIINRLYNLVVEDQLKAFIHEKKSIPIDDAIKRAKKKWQK